MKDLQRHIDVLASDAHALATEVERATAFAANIVGQAAAASVRLFAFSLGIAAVMHQRFLRGSRDAPP